MALSLRSMLTRRKVLYVISLGSVVIAGTSYFKNITLNYLPFSLPFRKSTRNKNNKHEYIYLPDEFKANQFPDEDYPNLSQADSLTTHWQLFRLARNARDFKVRNFALKKLATSDLSDFQSRSIAQCCDFTTSVSLARIPNVNPKLFLPPLEPHMMLVNPHSKQQSSSLPPTQFDIVELLWFILNEASKCDRECSECTKYFTNIALQILTYEKSLQEVSQPEDTDHIHRHQRSVFSKYYWVYLQALLGHSSCGEEQCLKLAENGLFLVLAHLRDKLKNNLKAQAAIAQILSNISLYPDLHKHFGISRWIGVLAEWINANPIELSLSSAKILSNLSSNGCKLGDSIYLLHPMHHDTLGQNDFDVIFVHGLMGGVFRTWRQCDSEKGKDVYTRCWPRSWLANDVDNIRILAVNYETYLSEWNMECPGDKYSLRDRSLQLVANLIDAKVGDKPIIWVTHSMGGLLVKQMLIDSASSRDSRATKLLDKTKGIVFYSVPHKGTEMAVWSPRLQSLIAPSTEVLELRKDSPFLFDLHQKFVQVVENEKIDCLSFGETLKSNVGVKSVKWKALLVPCESANPGIGIFHELAEDHYNTCKPKDRQSPSYCLVFNFIKSIIQSQTSDNQTHNRSKHDHVAIITSLIH